MDGDQDYVCFAISLATGVYTAYAVCEGDIVGFGGQEFGVVASVIQIGDYSLCDFTGVGVFEEFAVWGAFASGLDAVAVVNKDFHLLSGTAPGFLCKGRDLMGCLKKWLYLRYIAVVAMCF